MPLTCGFLFECAVPVEKALRNPTGRDRRAVDRKKWDSIFAGIPGSRKWPKNPRLSTLRKRKFYLRIQKHLYKVIHWIVVCTLEICSFLCRITIYVCKPTLCMNIFGQVSFASGNQFKYLLVCQCRSKATEITSWWQIFIQGEELLVCYINIKGWVSIQALQWILILNF